MKRCAGTGEEIKDQGIFLVSANSSKAVPNGIKRFWEWETTTSWTNEAQVSFYQKVESLPKKNEISYWQYALDKLIEEEFDADTITWLKSRPTLKDIPKILFDEAVRTWRKYLEDENWEKMKPEDKPRAFEYRYALYLLDYPDEFKFSTLDTYFYKGKKLSDLQK